MLPVVDQVEAAMFKVPPETVTAASFDQLAAVMFRMLPVMVRGAWLIQFVEATLKVPLASNRPSGELVKPARRVEPLSTSLPTTNRLGPSPRRVPWLITEALVAGVVVPMPAPVPPPE